MKIALSQNEIKEAVRQYMANEGFKLEGKIFDAAFSMGKGERGLSAIVTIESATADTTIPGFTGAASDEEESAALTGATEDTAQPGTVGAVITENAKAVVDTTAKADEEVKDESAPKTETKVEVKDAEPNVAAAAAGDEAGIFD